MQKDAARAFTIGLTFLLDEEAESAWATRGELEERFSRYGSSRLYRVDEDLRFLYISYLVEADSVLTAARLGLDLAREVFRKTNLNLQARGFRAREGNEWDDGAEET